MFIQFFTIGEQFVLMFLCLCVLLMGPVIAPKSHSLNPLPIAYVNILDVIIVQMIIISYFIMTLHGDGSLIDSNTVSVY